MQDSRLPQELSDLIGRIYDCALDPNLWKSTLEDIRSLFDGKVVQLALTDIKNRHYLITENLGVDESWMEAQHKHCRDIHAHEQRIRDNGLSMDEPMIFTRDIPQTLVETLPYFKEWSGPQGLVDFAHMNLLRSPNRISFLGVFRHEHTGVFSPRDIALLRFLIPHVRRAILINDAMEAKACHEARLSEALDALSLGVVLADEDSGILHANTAAEEMLRAGTAVRSSGGKLRVETPGAAAEVKGAIALSARPEVNMGKTGLAVRLSEDYEQPVVAHVLPLSTPRRGAAVEPKAVAAVFIKRPIDEAASVTALTRLYNLTKAEAKMLGPVLSGKTVPEAAEEIGVAVSTARTHLNHIFAKTNVARQSELMRLAATVASPLKQ
ncbi:MAG: helix-turn-helix transcriptional regulator [Hyphomicrobiales bacterium]|nr:helix-turn-helix transcriptional regulator [Hyphomicrobiales bacterium]